MIRYTSLLFATIWLAVCSSPAWGEVQLTEGNHQKALFHVAKELYGNPKSAVKNKYWIRYDELGSDRKRVDEIGVVLYGRAGYQKFAFNNNKSLILRYYKVLYGNTTYEAKLMAAIGATE